MNTYEREKEIEIEESAAIRALYVSPDGISLITGDEAFRISIWDLTTFSKRKIYRTHKSAVWALAYDENTKILFSGDDGGMILSHNLASENFLNELSGHTSRIQCLEISKDSEILFSGCRDHSIRI